MLLSDIQQARSDTLLIKRVMPIAVLIVGIRLLQAIAAVLGAKPEYTLLTDWKAVVMSALVFVVILVVAVLVDTTTRRLEHFMTTAVALELPENSRMLFSKEDPVAVELGSQLVADQTCPAMRISPVEEVKVSGLPPTEDKSNRSV